MSTRVGETTPATDERNRVLSIVTQLCWTANFSLRALSELVLSYVYEFVVEVTSTRPWFHKGQRMLRLRLATSHSEVPLHCEWYGNSSTDHPECTLEDNFPGHLESAFTLTGLGPNRLSILTANATRVQVYHWLSALPIPPTFHLVAESRCDCNMSHCGALQDLTLLQTCGDVFDLWGIPVEWNGRAERYLRPWESDPDSRSDRHDADDGNRTTVDTVGAHVNSDEEVDTTPDATASTDGADRATVGPSSSSGTSADNNTTSGDQKSQRKGLTRKRKQPHQVLSCTPAGGRHAITSIPTRFFCRLLRLINSR